MDEHEFEHHAAEAWKKVQDLFDDVDPDVAELEPSGDVIRVVYGNGARVVLNTQRPARQLWLAGGSRAWHFSFDAATGRWLDDKGRGDELLGTLALLTFEATGLRLRPRA